MATNDLIPLFLADPAEDPEQPGIGESLGHSGYLVANPQDKCFAYYRGIDRFRDSIGGKSTRVLRERHGFTGRHIGA